jgi:hypothetical protein
MAKRSRRHRLIPRPAVTDPIPTGDDSDQIAGRILAGELDSGLPALVEAINRRHRDIQDQRTADALAKLHIGDEVRINHDVSPQYLHGLLCEIHQIDDQHVIVCLGRPVGRFKSGHVRCPATALQPTGRVRAHT